MAWAARGGSLARAILFYVAFAAVLCVGLTAGGASAAAVSAENDAAASASQASAVLAAAAGPGAVRVLEAGTRGANGWYNATPAALVTDADAQRFSCTRTHPQYIRWHDGDEYRITFRTVQQRVTDADGNAHDLVSDAGQWVLFFTPGGALSSDAKPRFMYAASSAWPVPPSIGWMAVQGKRPLPRLELFPAPHPCDRLALDAELCAQAADPEACVSDAAAAALQCTQARQWAVGAAEAGRGRGLRPPLPPLLTQDEPALDVLQLLPPVDARSEHDGTSEDAAVDSGGHVATQSSPEGPPRAPERDAHAIAPHDTFVADSRVSCDAAAVYPHRAAARWCSCRNCAVRGGKLLLFAPSEGGEEPRNFMTPAASHYLHSYFEPVSDRVFATLVPGALARSTRCDTVVQQPAWFFAARRLHNMYHLFADALLPLYQSMVRHHGTVPSGARLWIQHDAHESQQRAAGNDDLESELRASAPGHALQLLRLLSPHPIGSRDTWDDIAGSAGTVCYRDLHVGLDVRGTFFHAGASAAESQHAVVDVTSDAAQAMASSQQAFVDFLLDGLDLPARSTVPRMRMDGGSGAVRERVVINDVQGHGAGGVQGLGNVAAVLKAVTDSTELPEGTDVEVVALAQLSVKDVAAKMAHTTVLVTTPDDMATAVAFLPRGAVLVLVSEPGLFGWKWLHANLALLSGVHTVAVRRPADADDTQGFDGVADHTQVQPDASSGELDLETLAEALEEAAALRRGDHEQATGDDPWFRSVPDTCEEEYADATEDDKPWYCRAAAGGLSS